MSLLTIVQNVADEVGIAKPTTVVGNTDPQVTQLLRLANRVGDILYKAHDWTFLCRLHEFTTSSSDPEYDLPSDFGRFVSDTSWDTSNYWEMRGPLTAQQWAVQKYAIIATANFRKRWRVKRDSGSSNKNQFYIDPTPSSADALVFEYVSNGWVILASDSSVTNAWAADADTTFFDEYLFEQGVIWRYQARKGFDVTIDLPDFENELEKAIARDGGSQRLSLNGRFDQQFFAVTQEGNFGGV